MAANPRSKTSGIGFAIRPFACSRVVEVIASTGRIPNAISPPQSGRRSRTLRTLDAGSSVSRGHAATSTGPSSQGAELEATRDTARDVLVAFL